jgi:hypothetical protein
MNEICGSAGTYSFCSVLHTHGRRTFWMQRPFFWVRLGVTHFQVEASQLLALDGSKGSVGDLLICRAIINHMDGKPAAQIPKHSEPFNRLASWPEAQLLRHSCARSARLIAIVCCTKFTGADSVVR